MSEAELVRVLVLWAHENSPNLGVGVLARGSRALVQMAWPGAEVVCVNYGERPRELPLSTRGMVKEGLTRRLGMRQWLAQFDLVWDTRSGDSFADIYGLDRHVTMSLLHELAVRSGVPVAIAPQTIGPFGSKRVTALARRNLKRSSLVFARDSISASVAADLGRPVDLSTTDMVFAIGAPEVEASRDVILNVSGLLWADNPHVDSTRYRSVVRETVRSLQGEGRDVALLAHVRHSLNSDDDVSAAQQLATEFSGVEVVIPDDLDAARQALGSAKAVIGSRMHACLNALSCGVPAIPMAYSRKFQPLLSDVGWHHGVDLRDASDPVEDVIRGVLDPSLAAEAVQVRRRGERMMADAAGVLRSFEPLSKA